MIPIRIDRVRKVFFTFLLLVFCSNMIMQARPNRGLVNCGNTCFMNATLQCLCSIPDFNEVLQRNKNKYERDSISKKYIDVIEGMRSSGSSSYDPKAFAKQIRNDFWNEGSVAGGGAQRDAHEFLTQLLSDHIISGDDLASVEAENKVTKWFSVFKIVPFPLVKQQKEKLQGIITEYDDKTGDKDQDKAEILSIFQRILGNEEVKESAENFLDNTNRDPAVLESLVFEEVRIKERVANEERESIRKDMKTDSDSYWIINDLLKKFFYLRVSDIVTSPIYKFALGKNTIETALQLPIEGDYLGACLNHYFGPEAVTLYDVGQEKKLSLVDLPKTLILSLKRFKVVTPGNYEKNDASVTFPVQDLDMRDYLSKDATDRYKYESTKYNLIGIVCQTGILSRGHYYAYAKDRDGDSWYYYNDEQVKSKPSDDIQKIANQQKESGTPYILFYQLDESKSPEKPVEVPSNFGQKIWEYTKTVVGHLKDKLNGDLADLFENFPEEGSDKEEEFYKKAALLIIDGAGADLGLLPGVDNKGKFEGIKNENSEKIRDLFGNHEKAAYLYRLMKTYISKLVVEKFLDERGDGLSTDGDKWKSFYVSQVNRDKNTLYKLAGF